MRLDIYLFEKKLFPSRDKAKEAITSGIISINGAICTKPSKDVNETADVKIVGQSLKYVSRAGLKLERAKDEWNIDFNDKIVLDVGASTGGFTDLALKSGAKKVYAVDVGTSQLHQSLKDNAKVINMEKTDFRTMPPLFDEIDIALCDCSFISLKLLSSKFTEVLNAGGRLVVLIKPQFECGIKIAQKTHGVIKEEKLQEQIRLDIISHFEKIGFKCLGSCPSPILGTAGNKEFLAYFVKK